ncbi:ABC transporter substrate-binding protein [Kineosporia succinea]|uniref:Peptide/nickel transport system substrate-binding protein n=1 Tax=Kineosporia succinea TaxID=84632 RepID=A0ABT9P7F6_9ACTN|nr:ABC transporter substrate-binding protein [Kineosporia succinea]MDP9828624.1 peptide/nickel transport system substrate-binding protein [Kineosporia succinea]
MRTRRTTIAVAAAAALTMGLAACGGGDSSGDGEGGAGGAVAFDAAITSVVNASDAKGGTIRYANEGKWDSTDPGNTYYGYAWNFGRYYLRTLVTYKSAPGAEGATPVPDLATDLGKPSDDAKTWTYTLKDGLKFEDGSPITSADVKYAVERQLDKATFPNGPTYFNDFLADVPDGYSPYEGGKGLDSIETPDDKTIVFHLNQSFSGFDNFAALPATAPVPKDKDTGSKYKSTVVSSGPYKFSDYQDGKSYTLVRNDQWDPATDEVRKALPDQIEVALNVSKDDLDQRLLAGDIDVAVTQLGIGSAARAQVLADPEKKKFADSAPLNRTWFTSINGLVAPFDNIDCRKAVIYAADRTGYQTAFGGALAGGEVATSLLPPTIPGQQKIDLYPVKDEADGIAKAKEALAACGQPDGFETNYSYRAERPAEKAAGESMQQALAKVGIKLTLKPYPQSDYFALYAGKPSFVKKEGLGLQANGWGADWPDGYGFLAQLVDSRVIRETGGATNTSVRDPEIDKMIDAAVNETDESTRLAAWAAIDKKTMEGAWVYPGVWAKVLLYRPENLTNVFVSSAWDGYDYAALGVKK